MARNVSDVLRIMRLAIGRRNENDPDSSDGTLLQYVNDFAELSMSDDVKLFEKWETLSFEIDETTTDGVYLIPSAETSVDFVNLTSRALISLTDTVGESLSWNELHWYQDPGIFYSKWGVNNEDIITTGFPTDVLYHGNQLVFRTIPDDSYTVYIYGYKKNAAFSSVGDPELDFDYWQRYLAYGAALQYALDYRYDPEAIARIEKGYKHERKLLLTRTHNQVKQVRGIPRF